MAVAVIAVSAALDDVGRLPRLAAGIAAGAAAYALSVLVLWTIAGRPAGAESYLHGQLGAWRARRS
jgi:hypothetical protein